MPSINVKAVGSAWNNAHPNSNYSTKDSWSDLYSSGSSAGCGSFAEFDSYDGYMGFGFKSPNLNAIKYKKITSIRIFYGDFVNRTWRYFKTTSEKSDTVDNVTPRYAYSTNRYSNITYNNRESHKYITKSGSGYIKSGSYLPDDLIKFYVDSWLNGYVVGTEDFKGKAETITNEYGVTVRTAYAHEVTNGSPYLKITYSNVVPVVTPSYPVDVNVKRSVNNSIVWNYAEEGSTSGLSSGQASYKLIITDEGGNSETFEGGEEHYKEFEADYFSIGNYSYTIQVTSKDGVTSNVASSTFTVIGGTDSPEITSITNDSIPTIEWTADYQDAVEIKISQNGADLFNSGLIIGSDITSYRVPMIFEDGEYTATIRVLNTYGYYSESASKFFYLNPEKPMGADAIKITPTYDFGVQIECTPSKDTKTFIIRRKSEHERAEVIGLYDERFDFFDYYVPGNKEYQYAVRSYNVGYTDSEFVSITLPLKGIVVRDTRDLTNYVEINESKELFDTDPSIKISSKLYNCLGRPYPVKERGEWISSTRKVLGRVSTEDYNRLMEMSLNGYSVVLQSNEEVITCDMVVNYDGRYIGGGVMVSLSFTQIDDNREVEYDTVNSTI